MRHPGWTDEQFEALKASMRRHTTTADAVSEYRDECLVKGWPERSSTSCLQKLQNKGCSAFTLMRKEASSPQKGDVGMTSERKLAAIAAERDDLRKRLREAEDAALTNEMVLDLIGAGKKAWSMDPPSWASEAPKSRAEDIPQLAGGFVSDKHGGEVVDPAQVRGYNEYNSEICSLRVRHTYKMFCEMPEFYSTRFSYVGFLLMSGGDDLSGGIHEHLKKTDDETPQQGIIRAIRDEIWGVELLKSRYKRVWNVRVPGNHSRSTEKVESKDFAYQNYDWLISMIVAEHFKDDPDVRISCPPAFHVVFQVFREHWFLTHGFEIKGGSGISGIETPVALARHRALRAEQVLGDGFDVYNHAHHHTHGYKKGYQRNGSVVGFNEFAILRGYEPEPPQCIHFIVDPRRGIVFPSTVFCDPKSPKIAGFGSADSDAVKASLRGAVKWD
ncbi:MAG: hypothetical protein M0R06_17680 [Sphaerochaeta sp.]|nr:hypothetical protein [Sphaerochaeta sp.]